MTPNMLRARWRAWRDNRRMERRIAAYNRQHAKLIAAAARISPEWSCDEGWGE